MAQLPHNGATDDDVGDLDFIFTPADLRRDSAHQPAEPWGTQTEVGRRWRARLLEELQREGRDPGDLMNQATWYVQMQEELWRERRRARGQEDMDLLASTPLGQLQLQLWNDRQPHGPHRDPTAAANLPQGIQNDNTASNASEELIFDFDLGDDGSPKVPTVVQREVPSSPEEPGADQLAELQDQVARQQRYVDNIRDQINITRGGGGDGAHEVETTLRQAQGALRTLQEALEAHHHQQQPPVDPGVGTGGDGAANNDANLQQGHRHCGIVQPGPLRSDQTDTARAAAAADGGDFLHGAGGARDPHSLQDRSAPNDRPPTAARRSRRGPRRHERHPSRRNSSNRRAQRRGLSPAARRRVQQDLDRLRQDYEDLQHGGDLEDLQEIQAEIQYLEDVLSGKFLQMARQGNNDQSDGEEEEENNESEDEHIYLGPALSDEDARLPPAGVPMTELIELYDDEGPRYRLLVTLDNPDPDAVKQAEEAQRKAREKFARYEAPFFTVIERATDSRALREVNRGPRGVIWVVEAGREDVLGALLAGREQPFGIRTWAMLGLGVGGSEGAVFMLHTPDEQLSGEGESGSSSGGTGADAQP